MNTAVLFFTHVWTPVIKRSLLKLSTQRNYTLYVIYNVFEDESNMLNNVAINFCNKYHINIFYYKESTVKQFLSAFNYDVDPVWNVKTRPWVWNNIMYPFMYFYFKHDTYDNYWYIENDVYFNGDLSNVIDFYHNKKSDYVCGYLAQMNGTVAMRYNYTTVNISKEFWEQVFNPVFMLSKRAIQKCDEIYREGNSAYIEIFIYTVLHYLKTYRIDFLKDDGFVEYSTFTFYEQDEINEHTIKNRFINHHDTCKFYHPVK